MDEWHIRFRQLLSIWAIWTTPWKCKIYGYNPDLRSPFDKSDNNVVVHTVSIENATVWQSEFLQAIDLLAKPSEMGIDIYEEVLHLLQINET